MQNKDALLLLVRTCNFLKWLLSYCVSLWGDQQTPRNLSAVKKQVLYKLGNVVVLELPTVLVLI